MANLEGKADAVFEWAKGWPHLDGYLKLNAIVTQDGEASIDISYNDVSVVEYNDGTALREYTFQLRIITPWSSGYDQTNVEAEKLAANWLDWVADQYKLGNVPDFGEDAEIKGIYPTQNTPALNAVYGDEEMAEYLIQAIIRYVE